MLLHKYRGKGNQQRHSHKGGPPQGCPEPFRIPRAKGHRHRTYHMQGRADIGIGIKRIEARNKTGQEIIPFKLRWPQQLTGWINRIYHRRHRIGNHDEV